MKKCCKHALSPHTGIHSQLQGCDISPMTEWVTSSSVWWQRRVFRKGNRKLPESLKSSWGDVQEKASSNRWQASDENDDWINKKVDQTEWKPALSQWTDVFQLFQLSKKVSFPLLSPQSHGPHTHPLSTISISHLYGFMLHLPIHHTHPPSPANANAAGGPVCVSPRVLYGWANWLCWFLLQPQNVSGEGFSDVGDILPCLYKICHQLEINDYRPVSSTSHIINTLARPTGLIRLPPLRINWTVLGLLWKIQHGTACAGFISSTTTWTTGFLTGRPGFVRLNGCSLGACSKIGGGQGTAGLIGCKM